MNKSRLKLSTCLAILFASVTVTFLVSVIVISGYSQKIMSKTVSELSELAIVQMREDAVEALSGLGLSGVSVKMEAVVGTNAVRYIEMYDASDMLILSSGDISPSAVDVTKVSHQVRVENSSLSLIVPDTKRSKVIGKIVIGLDNGILVQPYRQSQNLYLTLFVGSCVIAVLLFNLILSLRVLKPVREIDRHLDMLSIKPWSRPKLDNLYGDEIGQIAKKVDDTAMALYEIEIRSKAIENQMVLSEERADAVLISSLKSMSESAQDLDEEVKDLDKNLVSLLTYAERDDQLTLSARNIFRTMKRVRSYVSILQASGEINRSIMRLSPKDITLAELLALINNVLQEDGKDTQREYKNILCRVDYLRLSILLQKLAGIFQSFSVKIEQPSVSKDAVILSIRLTELESREDKDSEREIKELSRALLDGKVNGDIGDIKENDIIYIQFLAELLGADLNITWSRISQTASASLQFSIDLSASELNPLERSKGVSFTLVTDDNPVMPSKFFTELYGIAVSVIHPVDAEVEKLALEDCVLLDCAREVMNSSIELANSINEYCATRRLKKPKLGALFYRSESGDELMKALDMGNFDFPYHKPYKLNKILSDYDQLVNSRDLSDSIKAFSTV